VTGSVTITGVSDVLRQLHGLSGAELQKKAARSLAKSVRAEVVPVVKAEAPVTSTGHPKGRYPHPARNLRDSITARSLKRRGPDELAAYSVWPRSRKGAKHRGWYRHMVILGTKPHMITARGHASPTATAIVRRFNRGGALALHFGGLFVPMVRHPGARANPFIARALTRIDQHAILDRLRMELSLK